MYLPSCWIAADRPLDDQFLNFGAFPDIWLSFIPPYSIFLGFHTLIRVYKNTDDGRKGIDPYSRAGIVCYKTWYYT